MAAPFFGLDGEHDSYSSLAAYERDMWEKQYYMAKLAAQQNPYDRLSQIAAQQYKAPEAVTPPKLNRNILLLLPKKGS